jgi:hypothetical protein
MRKKNLPVCPILLSRSSELARIRFDVKYSEYFSMVIVLFFSLDNTLWIIFIYVNMWSYLSKIQAR